MFQGVRNQGVLRTGGERDEAPAKKVTNISRAEMFAVRFGDEQGHAHTVVVMKAGNQWYMPPNAEEWSRALKPLAPWLAKDLEQQLAHPDTTPPTDTVDVLGAEK